MNIIIVEDEVTATRKLETLLKRIKPEIEVLARLESVKETVSWIKQNKPPNLAFFDIQLADDVSFEIFKQVEVTFPVIFVTAYDNYLLQAFEQNTIHYLLKPITEDKVRVGLEKLDRVAELFGSFNIPENTDNTKDRLLVRKGVNFIPIDTNRISYIFSEHKISFAKDNEGTIYMLDQSLSELEKMLDPKRFFRANRQYLVNLQSIKKFRSIEQSKIKLDLNPPTKEDVIIGKENAGMFRKWIKNIL